MRDETDEMFKVLLNRPLVDVTHDSESVTFRFQDGGSKTYRVMAYCCSSSWIEHLENSTTAGAIITRVEDGGEVPWDGHTCKGGYNPDKRCEHNYLQVYNTRFHTDQGTITLEYRNDSNGYYGGYLVSDSLKEVENG